MGKPAAARTGAAVVLGLVLGGLLPAQTGAVYDTWGVPHVIAPTDRLAFYATGRVHMRDFPVTTAYNLWWASGRLSEKVGIHTGVFGGEAALQQDVAMRLWRIPERVAADHAPRVLADPRLGPLLEAYVAGLNEGRRLWNRSPGQRDALAGRTEPHRLSAGQIARLLEEPFAAGQVLGFALAWTGFTARAGIQRLVEGVAPGAAPTASNAWMVSRNASTSGNAMLASDPHLSVELPSQFRGTFATLQGARLHVGGWLVPGLPTPLLGFNETVAWAATSNGVDHHDVWQAGTDSPGGYTVTGQGTQPVVRQAVTLQPFELAAGAPSSRTVDLAWADAARNLPVLDEEVHGPGTPGYSTITFAGATFATAPHTLLEALLGLAYATDLTEVAGAVGLHALSDQNLLCLHRDGDMRYWWVGRVPVRPAQAPGPAQLLQVLDGNDPAHRWGSGVHPVSSLPAEVYTHGPAAPPEVWINCNVFPDLVRPQGAATVDPTAFPAGGGPLPGGGDAHQPLPGGTRAPVRHPGGGRALAAALPGPRPAAGALGLLHPFHGGDDLRRAPGGVPGGGRHDGGQR